MNLLGGQIAAADAAADRELEQVLLGLADGSYVLSTPDGCIAESGAGVAGLLGAPAEPVVGQPIADVLIAGADAQARQDFEQLLRAPSGDPAARRTFSARCAEGATRSLQFVVVCVPLALGWEFTSLLSELRSRDVGSWRPEELRLRHGRALEAVEGVVRQGAQPDPSARLAGILIVVRDVAAPPLTNEDVERRMTQQRTAARATAAEAARRADEAAGRGAPADGDDASAQAPGLEDLVERARLLRERVDDAEREAAAAVAERDDALVRLAESEAERDAAKALASAADDVEGRARQLARERDEARDRLETMAREIDDARRDAESARAEAQAAQAEVSSVRADLDQARAELERTRAGLEATLATAENVRAEREQARVHARQLMDEADRARAAAEAIRAEFAFEPIEDGDDRQAKPEVPAVGPGEAAALIAPDGSFRRLDEAFCSLLGCREEDLRAARWPSIIDRENLEAHQEIARALKAGEIRSAEIETVYMHAQGLLVPIAGTVSLHHVAGEPHILFRADVSRTSGVPGVL